MLLPTRQFADAWSGVPGKVRIVSVASDFETLALPMAASFRARGIETSSSCVWPSRREVSIGTKSELAPISMSYDEDSFDEKGTALLIVSSFVETTTVIESILTYAHPLQHIRYNGIAVFAPFAVRGTSREFRLSLRQTELEQFVWQTSYEVSDEFRDRLRPLVNSWIAEPLGLPSPEAVSTYFPRRIIEHLDSHPRPENLLAP